jgi:hypothetical protein
MWLVFIFVAAHGGWIPLGVEFPNEATCQAYINSPEFVELAHGFETMFECRVK